MVININVQIYYVILYKPTLGNLWQTDLFLFNKCLPWIRASCKILTAGPGATEERIKDRALTQHQIIPGASQRTMNCCKAERSWTEHQGEGRSTFNLHFLISSCYVFIIFWDLFYHSMIWSFLFFLNNFWVLFGLYNLFPCWFMEGIFIDQMITSQSCPLIQSWRLLLKNIM